MPRELLSNAKTFNFRFYFIKFIFMHIYIFMYAHTYLNMNACVYPFFFHLELVGRTSGIVV